MTEIIGVMKLSRISMRALFIFFLTCAFVVSPTANVAAFAPKSVDLVVRGGTVVTMDERGSVIEDGAVAVHRGRIVAGGKRADIYKKYGGGGAIGGRRRGVMHALINGHTHVPPALFFGLA